MKTTNYENSKKLAEIGFKAKSDLSWNVRTTYCGNVSKSVQYFIKYNTGFTEGEEICKSYDFETLLNALPKNIRKENDFVAKLRIFTDEEGDNLDGSTYIGYQTFEGFIPKFTEEQGIHETLADCASRLLVKLFEANLINFKK